MTRMTYVQFRDEVVRRLRIAQSRPLVDHVAIEDALGWARAMISVRDWPRAEAERFIGDVASVLAGRPMPDWRDRIERAQGSAALSALMKQSEAMVAAANANTTSRAPRR